MKKLMVLSLVLVISAVSSAALSFVNFDNDVNTSIFGSENQLYGGAIVAGIGSPIDIEFIYTGDAKAVVPVTDPGFLGMLESLVGAPVDFAWQFTFAHLDAANPIYPRGEAVKLFGTGAADLYMYNQDGVYQDMTSLVPEPMTMGLLGLGALFLRRRK